MIIPIELRFKADKDSKSAFRTDKTIKSHDVNSVEFHITVDGLELTDTHTAKILSVFHSSTRQVNVECEIVNGKIIYKPDTNLISRHEHVTNYVYVYNGNQSLDVREFIYTVDLSKIDETSLEVKAVYDQSYADLLADFEQALEDYKLTLPQADSVRADIDEILNQFSEDSQAKLSQYDTDAQQVIADNQTAFGLAETGRQDAYEQAEDNRNQTSNQVVVDWEQDADALLETVEGNESVRVDAEASRVEKESERVQAETERIQAEQARKEAETLREESYEQKVDTAIVEADVVEKVDNKVTELTPRMNDLTAQLAQTPSYEEARLKTEKIELEDMAETTLGAMSGNATFNLLSEPQTDSVNIEKLSPNLRKDLLFIAENNINNGNFSSDSNNDGLADKWEKGSDVTSVRLENNTQYWLATATNWNGRIGQTLPKKLTVGHQYYFSLEVTSVGFIYLPSGCIKADKNGLNGKLSFIFTPTKAGEDYLQVRPLNTTNESSVKFVSIIDLTETFGFGKEPKKEEFEFILSKYSIGWFDSLNLANAKRSTILTAKGLPVYDQNNNLDSDNVNDALIEIDTRPINSDRLEDGSVSPKKTTFIEKSKNLFDGEYRRLFMGYDGRFSEGTSGNDRGFILELEPNTDYTISKTDSSAFRVGLRPTKPEGSGGATTLVFDDANANEFSFKTDSENVHLVVYVGSSKIPDFLQIEKGSEATEWVTYGHKFKNEIVPYFLEKDTENPSYYGIKGDGITDDTKALRDYANHLRESGGGVLELPPGGTVLFTETISIPSNVLVRGNMATLILGDDYVLEPREFRGNPVIFPYITTDTNSTDIHFENLTIQGNTNDFRNQRHTGLSFMDAERVSAVNVNVYDINYNVSLAENIWNYGYNISTVRAKDAYIYGGTFDKGGYECVGVEQSQGVTIDNVRSGRAWRTSLQIHRNSQNIKVLNSTIRQVTDTEDAGALTLHGEGGLGQGLKNIQLIGNTINGEFSSEPLREYNALIQIMDGGTAEDILVKNNVLKGNRTGIFGAPTKNFSVLGNHLMIEKGNGIHVYVGSSNVLIDQNIVEVMDGIALSVEMI